MRITRDVVVGERTFVVRELTVGEIRQWLASLEAQLMAPDVVGVTLFAEASLDDLHWLSDVMPEDVEKLTPSEIREVLAAAQAVNKDFFAMRGRLEAAGRSAPPEPGSRMPSAA